MASWIRRLAFWRRSSEPLALDARWPRWLSNVYPATIFFVGLTWLELGWGVTMSPRATAVLGLLMLVMAVVPALFFEKRAFCKYACLVGRICGLYSLLAPVEIRAKDRDVCKEVTPRTASRATTTATSARPASTWARWTATRIAPCAPSA